MEQKIKQFTTYTFSAACVVLETIKIICWQLLGNEILQTAPFEKILTRTKNKAIDKLCFLMGCPSNILGDKSEAWHVTSFMRTIMYFNFDEIIINVRANSNC